MKNILLYILLLTATFSCDVLNLEQKSSISYNEAFGSYERCELSTVGCYAYAQGSYRGFPFGSRALAMNDVRGEDVASSTYLGSSYESTFTTSTGDLSNLWSYLFKLVNQCNIVIDGVRSAAKSNTITEDECNSFEAEARFLRALALHEAMVFYALPYNATPDASHYGVPVVLVPCNTIEAVNEAYKSGRATAEATYKQIIADLDFAEKCLPELRTGTAKISRATKGAAIALKTRIYLHTADYENVVNEASKLVDVNNISLKSKIGGYNLTEDVAGPFLSNSDNTESIFSIENTAADNPTLDGALGQLYYGRKDIAISPVLYNAKFWDKDDLRRSMMTMIDGKYFTAKYPKYVDMDDWAPIIRYAEVLLNYAEAEARLNGVTSVSLALLNKVRNRAVKDESKHYTLSSFVGKEELVNTILNERRIEFVCEGKRWYDIHRLSTDPVFAVKISTGEAGIPAKVNTGNIVSSDYNVASGSVNAELFTISEIPYGDRRFIFPIPQSEINANSVMAEQQNEGWD